MTQSVGSREPAAGRRLSPSGPRRPTRAARLSTILGYVEDAIGSFALLVMVVLPLAAIRRAKLTLTDALIEATATPHRTN